MAATPDQVTPFQPVNQFGDTRGTHLQLLGQLAGTHGGGVEKLQRLGVHVTEPVGLLIVHGYPNSGGGQPVQPSGDNLFLSGKAIIHSVNCST